MGDNSTNCAKKLWLYYYKQAVPHGRRQPHPFGTAKEYMMEQFEEVHGRADFAMTWLSSTWFDTLYMMQDKPNESILNRKPLLCTRCKAH